MSGHERLTAEERGLLRRLKVSAGDLCYHGENSYGSEYSLLNEWFYIAGTFDGYDKDYIYRALARKLIARCKEYVYGKAVC